MPRQSNSASMSGSERIRKQNLARIQKIRMSKNKHLTDLIDEMEQTMTARLGADGYMDFLGKAPLDVLLKRFGNRRRQPATSQMSSRDSVAGGQRSGQEGGIVSGVPLAPDGKRDYSDRYSTDTEQSLLAERENASAQRRRQLDEELDAIHANRMCNLEDKGTFDEFDAEDALRHARNTNGEMPNGSSSAKTGASASMAGTESTVFSGSAGTRGKAALGPHSAEDESGKNSDSPDDKSNPTDVVLGSPVAGNGPIEAPTLDDGLHSGAGFEWTNRGALSESDDSNRGSLNDLASSLKESEEQQKEAQKQEQKEKDKKKRRLIMHVIAQMAPIVGPILIVVIALLMLAKCVDELNPFSGSGGTAADVTNANGVSVGTAATGATPATRRNNANGLPTVYVDSALNDMFTEDEEEEEEEEEAGEEEDGELTDAQQRVIDACHSTPSPGVGWCAAWVGDVFQNANVGVSFRGDARDWFHAFCKAGEPYCGGTVSVSTPAAQRDYSTLKVGMIVAVPSSSSGTAAGATYGHIGIYIGNHTVIHNIGSIEEWDIDRWVDTYGQYTDVGWGWADGVKLGGSGEKKSGGSEKIGDALNLHISSQKDIKKWARKIDKYLAGHGAVKMGFKGKYFAEAAAKYGIDPRLSAAQSCIEQSRGDVINTGDYYNLWGWGVYGSNNGLIHTSNARDACFKHAKGLAEGYGSSFGPAQVAMYCPGNSQYWPMLKGEAETITNL